MAMLRFHGLALLLGFLLDICFGDPRWLYHPICLIGNMIGFLRRYLADKFPQTPGGQRAAGKMLVLLVCVSSFTVPVLLLLLAYRIHPLAGFILESFWCYQLLAAKSLKKESMKVYTALRKEDLKGARHAVSMIVGRDTQSLTAEGVTKATVETIAENTADGVIAPMFYMAIGGAPLMFLYKAINTMDSMVGYKDEKYLHLGRCAAKLDDAANYIPARLSAFLMVAASFTLGMNGRSAWKIFRRDRYNHASPNSAQTESVVAGALEIQLAGDAWYFGKKYEKPTIGDPIRAITYEDIRRANCLMYQTSVLGVLVMTGVLLIL